MYLLNKTPTLLLAVYILSSCFLLSANPVVIQGIWDTTDKDEDNVSLFKVVSGRLEPISAYYLEEGNQFGFSFTPSEEAFYVIGDNGPNSKIGKVVLYIKPGDQLNIEMKGNTCKLVGENSSAENKMMFQWRDYIYPIHNMAVYYYREQKTYVDFFPLIDETVANPFIITETGNHQFDNLFRRFIEADFLSNAITFLSTPRITHPHLDDYPDYYRNIDIASLSVDDFLMHYPFGANLLNTAISRKLMIDGFDSGYIARSNQINIIKDNALKGEYVLSKAPYIKNYLSFRKIVDMYQDYFVTKDQKTRVAAIAESLAKEATAAGQMVDFAHQDIDGNYKSLSEFKGKVVLLDVWATWCGPCLSEIQHLKALDEKYKGKDFVIISVSVDEKHDCEIWKKFIKEENLPGVQLFAGGFDSDVANFYNIESIPRFLLFDKEGNIVAFEAPRPSDNELTLLIDNELKK